MQKVAKFEKVSKAIFVNDYENLNLADQDLNVTYQQIILPKRATCQSAGYDFYAPFDFELQPNQSITIPTSIRVYINAGWYLALFPRSGLGFKYRLQLDNTVGIIDGDYYYSDNEGHILIKITNDSKTQKTLHIKKGEAFAQGVLMQYGITIDDNTTKTRNGGFGSTTK